MKFIPVLLLLFLAACAPRHNTSDLSAGMTKQEVISMLGKPVSGTMANGNQQLVFFVHDHAYGRDENYYSATFKNDRLEGITLLPEDQQDQGGPIDRLNRLRLNIHTTN